MSVHEQFAEDLTLYALGSLDGAERQALEKHLEGCSACRRELEQLRGDVSLIALTTAGPKPPARSRQRLMAAIASEPRPMHGTMDIASSSRPRSWSESPFLGWAILGWVTAAAVAVICFALLRQNSALHGGIALLQGQLTDQSSKLQEANSLVATLVDPDAMKIELVAAGNKPQPRGKAIYQRRNRNLIFLASNLPPLAADKIYELWLFPANGGPPVGAGLFKPDVRGSATVVNPPLPEGVAAKNFAVTLEPVSGTHEAPRGTVVIAGQGE